MCEITAKANIGKVNGRHIRDVYPIQNRNLPYAKAAKDTCPHCETYLGEGYATPHGHCTRAFCQDAYQGITGNLRDTCSLCETELPEHKRNAQESQRREIVNHFCDECVEYLGHIYRKVAGMDTSYLADEQPQIEYQPQSQTFSFAQNHRREREKVPARYNNRDVVTLYQNAEGEYAA